MIEIAFYYFRAQEDITAFELCCILSAFRSVPGVTESMRYPKEVMEKAIFRRHFRRVDEAPPELEPATIPTLRSLPELPDDMAEAFDSMKLSIMRHRHDNWQEISKSNVLLMLRVLEGIVKEKPNGT